jgi:hypothetical protein
MVRNHIEEDRKGSGFWSGVIIWNFPFCSSLLNDKALRTDKGKWKLSRGYQRYEDAWVWKGAFQIFVSERRFRMIMFVPRKKMAYKFNVTRLNIFLDIDIIL